MGVVSSSNIITGSASNTLGTIGKSLFNSTLGAVSDKETTDKIYDTIDKLNSSIETVDKTIDIEALSGRNKSDDLFTLLASLDIKSSSDFMNKNREFLKRLMRLNANEKDITLNAIGVDVTGESNVIRNEYVRNYEHVGDNNYTENYVKNLARNQQSGDETTMLQLESSGNLNYAGIHNDLYMVNQNLYPDDENNGSFSNKWLVENRNSLLYKTKKLFNSKKINTIISRFHTDPSRIPSALDNAKSKYGLSHGRNLLTKEAENGYNSSYANGYDNPYCRVWTHHHQYDRYYKTIRPFSSIDGQGNFSGSLTTQDFHKWRHFSDEEDTPANYDGSGGTLGEWGWKKEANNGWQYSVLNGKNGRVNITPKYVEGGNSNIHTKQCMFSIENLAWKGYDPYSFEQALSWEQRGPLGGRIMWFPPYNIQFSETTTTQWGSNTFLGRGEDVYTYTNTTRSGTLSFMMVVDHPSLIDYVSWSSENNNVTDTDILRFFAGCGENGDMGLRNAAQPTPLTDEYVQEHMTAYAQQDLTKEIVEEKPGEEVIVITPEEEVITNKSFCFYVFYPNNYSGVYDDKDSDIRQKYQDINSKVEPIPYLIAGKGAQKKYTKPSEDTKFENDIELLDEKGDEWIGEGYEMHYEEGDKGSNKALSTNVKSEDKNYIVGCGYNNSNGKKPRFWTGLKGDLRKKSYTVDNSKKFYYRIDGRYVYPQDVDEERIHYYNQATENNTDDVSYGLNNNIKAIEKYNKEVKPDSDDNTKYIDSVSGCEVFTLAEVAYVLYEGNSELQKKCNIENPASNERINRLKTLLSKENLKDIQSIRTVGYASAHGYLELNKHLALNRGKTAAHWFLKHIEMSHQKDKIEAIYEPIDDSNVNEKVEGDKTNEGHTSGNASNAKSKANRYAKIIVNMTSSEMNPVVNSLGTVAEDETPLLPEKVATTGFLFEYDSTIDNKNVSPIPNGESDDNFKPQTKFEMSQNEDSNYILTIDKDYYLCFDFREENYEKSNEKIKINNVEYKKTRSFTFVYTDNTKNENHCLVSEYNAVDEKTEKKTVVCFARNEYETYFFTKNPDFTEELKIRFIDAKPIELQTNKYYFKDIANSEVTIAHILFDPNKQELICIDALEKQSKVRIVSIVKHGDDNEEPLDNAKDKDVQYEITLVDGGKLTISYEYKYHDEVAGKKDDFTYRQINVITPTFLIPALIGKNNYYVTKPQNKDFQIKGDTVLSIQKNCVEIIKLTEDKTQPDGKLIGKLTMRFKEPKGNEAPFSENYPEVTIDIESYVIDQSGDYNVYRIYTKEHGNFFITVYTEKNAVSIERKQEGELKVIGISYVNMKILEKYEYEKEAPDVYIADEGCNNKLLWIVGEKLYMWQDFKKDGTLLQYDGVTHTVTNTKEEGKYTIRLKDDKTIIIKYKNDDNKNDLEITVFDGEKKPLVGHKLYKDKCCEINLEKLKDDYFYIGASKERKHYLGYFNNIEGRLKIDMLNLSYENEDSVYEIKNVKNEGTNTYVFETCDGDITITNKDTDGFLLKFESVQFPLQYKSVLKIPNDNNVENIYDAILTVTCIDYEGVEGKYIDLNDGKITVYYNNNFKFVGEGSKKYEYKAESLIYRDNWYYLKSECGEFELNLNVNSTEGQTVINYIMKHDGKQDNGYIGGDFYSNVQSSTQQKSRAMSKAKAQSKTELSVKLGEQTVLVCTNGEVKFSNFSDGKTTYTLSQPFQQQYEYSVITVNKDENGTIYSIFLKDNSYKTVIVTEREKSVNVEIECVDGFNPGSVPKNFSINGGTVDYNPISLDDIDFEIPDEIDSTPSTPTQEEKSEPIGVKTTSTGGESSDVLGSEIRYVGYSPLPGETGFYNGEEYPIYVDENNKKWYKVTDPNSKIAKFISLDYAAEEDVTPKQRNDGKTGDKNRLRYDQEYHFFKVLEQTDPVVFNSLMDKIKYFDPAFHSMTPEGFNGRLTFLQQCMRQGNTVSASDGKFAKNANNLAFGRAPYCVLRLGDFYNQLIVIENMSINYDPLVWDLNVEGVGVQPLLATVQLSFKFIGGGDLTGPVRRLQNAMSFNYYANARLYDNRADRVERMWSDKTCGAIQNDEINTTSYDYYDAAYSTDSAVESAKLLDMAKRKEKQEEVYAKDKNGNMRVSSYYNTKMYK